MMNDMNRQKNLGVIILAAGLGKRMRSPLPKVLHEVCGKPLIFHVLNQVRKVNPSASVAIVVGHGREKVESYLKWEPFFKEMDLSFVVQGEQKGTGHAVRCAMDASWGESRVKIASPILVLPGDLPLMSPRLIEEMLEPLASSSVMRLLTCELSDPSGYGRILRRSPDGPVIRIIEEKDASSEQRKISEVGASIYLFQSKFLKNSILTLSNKNVQGEYYLTDLVEKAGSGSEPIEVLKWREPEDLRGVNDLWELSQAAEIMNARILKSWCLQGVKIIDPKSSQMDITVELSEGSVLYPNVTLLGETRIGRNTSIGSHVILKDVQVGDSVNLKPGTIAEQSKIESEAQVGPYAHLRPGSHVGTGAKIGNFVELKKTRVGSRTSIAHLSYLGDAEVGDQVNIGCGFITCNYDGRVIRGERKHKTIIENEVFMGSDCQTIAPVRIGKGSFIASGSTITEDVEEGSLAIARSRQINKAGYAQKFKKNSED